VVTSARQGQTVETGLVLMGFRYYDPAGGRVGAGERAGDARWALGGRARLAARLGAGGPPT
jgi:hypothetical protein